jgi:hypothetical protein
LEQAPVAPPLPELPPLLVALLPPARELLLPPALELLPLPPEEDEDVEPPDCPPPEELLF